MDIISKNLLIKDSKTGDQRARIAAQPVNFTIAVRWADSLDLCFRGSLRY